MNGYCEPCGIFHPTGACQLIRELRANATPSVPFDQLMFTDVPTTLCRACGATLVAGETLCDPCDVAIGVAEHQGNTNYLTSGQLAVVRSVSH